MIFFVLAVACLATFRITRFVTHDKLTTPARAWLMRRNHKSYLTYFVYCTWCVSIWVAGGVVLVLDRFATVPLPWAVVLTASAITGIVEAHIPED